MPSEPSRSGRPILDLGLGLGSGLVLGVLSAVGVEALDTTVRTREEVEAACGLPTLAVIPQVTLLHPPRAGRAFFRSSKHFACA